MAECKHKFTRDPRTLDWRCLKCNMTRFRLFVREHRIIGYYGSRDRSPENEDRDSEAVT